MKNTINLSFFTVTIIILVAALSRLFTWGIPNFSPVGGIALFGAAYLSRRHLAIIIPLLAFWISDLFLNNVIYGVYFEQFVWFGMPAVYLSILAITGIGFVLLKKIKWSNLIVASLSASILFFLITNLASWWTMPVYTKDGVGLMTAYLAGIPFFWNTLLGDLFFTGVLFGGYELLKAWNPALEPGQ